MGRFGGQIRLSNMLSKYLNPYTSYLVPVKVVFIAKVKFKMYNWAQLG